MLPEKTRVYTHIKELGPIIDVMFAQGRTRREIAEELGLPGKETVKEYLKRKRRAEKRPPKTNSGRPRKSAITETEELRRENQRLQMELDLMRSFLHETEGR